jgi:hypothetical protein
MSDVASTLLLIIFYLQLAFILVVYAVFQIRLFMYKEQTNSVNMFSEIVAEDASDVSILQNQPRSPAYVNATIDMVSVTIK